MRDGIAMIKSATQFWELNNLLKGKNSDGLDIAGVINDEFGGNNTWSLQVIVNHLKTIGINSTFNKDAEGNYIEGSFKITSTPTNATQTTTLPEWTKTYPCLSDRGTMSVTTNPKVVSYTTEGDTYYFYDDKSFIYQFANKTQIKGTWDCVNNKLLIKLEDGEQWQKDTGWVKQKTSGGGTQIQKTVITIPSELKDENGVKAFQDWLDVNAAGWATGYKEGIINKGQNGGGYGRFGPRTQKGWATYKDTYLKSATSVNPYADYKTVETNDKVEGDNTEVPEQ
jgi:hypothetical protein